MINRRVLWDHQVVQLPSTVTVALTMQEEASDSMGNVAPRFLSAITILANGVLAEQTFCNFLPLIVKQTTGNLQVRRHDTVGPDKLTMRLGNMQGAAVHRLTVRAIALCNRTVSPLLMPADRHSFFTLSIVIKTISKSNETSCT